MKNIGKLAGVAKQYNKKREETVEAIEDCYRHNEVIQGWKTATDTIKSYKAGRLLQTQ